MRPLVALVIAIVGASACGDVNAALEQLSQARNLSGDLLVQFTKATDASKQKDVDALEPILRSLRYGDENRLLQDHAIHYVVSTPSPNVVVFLAPSGATSPGYRLTYHLESPRGVSGTFELSTPGTSAFATYLSWRMNKR